MSFLHVKIDDCASIGELIAIHILSDLPLRTIDGKDSMLCDVSE